MSQLPLPQPVLLACLSLKLGRWGLWLIKIVGLLWDGLLVLGNILALPSLLTRPLIQVGSGLTQTVQVLLSLVYLLLLPHDNQ